MIPAVGQGILGVQLRQEPLAERIRQAIDDPEVRLQATAERAFLGRFQGDCQVPLAAHARLRDSGIHLLARVVSLDGVRTVEVSDTCGADEAAARELGREVAERILDKGGREILTEIGVIQ
jgi:hydroxymethylbilane synthase